MKKSLTIFFVIVITGVSFFYTEKIVKLARNADPIMIEINNVKKDLKIDNVKPIITNDEYISGINGCVVNEQESYNKMKQVGKFDDNLLVMKSNENNVSTKNKYIVAGNKKIKNVSIIIEVNNEFSSSLYNFLREKKTKLNFFVDGYFLDNNLIYVQKLSKIGNIYNGGRDQSYNESTIIYDNSVLESVSNNKSNYCFVSKKNKKTLKLCNNYDMDVVKGNYISSALDVKEDLSNGKIIVLDDIEEIKIKMIVNYILSKGYNIVTLDTLLSEENDCNY